MNHIYAFDNPVGVVDLEELDRISKISGSGDGEGGGVEPQSTPVIATILASVISFEATITAYSATVEC